MFLLFGLGVLPLLIFLVASVIIIAATESDAHRYSIGSLVVGAGLIIWVTKVNPLPWIAANVLWLVLGIAGYFVAGIVWGFFKWYLFNLSIRDRIVDEKLKAVTKEKFENTWKGERAGMVIVPVSPRNHKSRIVGWMTYWPWSAVWFLLNDPVRRAWNAIYNRLVAKLEAVSNHVFKNVPTLNGKA